MEETLEFQRELPIDVVCYILVRLPVKSLSRFRCVSKQWCSLIAHPHFLKEHSYRSQQNPLFLIAVGTNDDDTLVRFTTYTNQGLFLREFNSYKFQPFAGFCRRLDFQLIPSYLGLVCFRQMGDNSARICNPSTEEVTVLPALPKGYVSLCLGFGFAASTEEYKVARFFVKQPVCEEGGCDVFTVGANGRWREARTRPPHLPPFDAHLPFLHGALHFMPDEDLLAQHDRHYIAVFDLDTEEYRALPYPEICCQARISSDNDQLCELRGSLCMTLASTENEKILEVWLLKDYLGGKWVKQYNIDLSSVPFASVTLLTMVGDSYILLNFLLASGTELCYYNLRCNCLANRIATDCEATFYFESFSSVRSSYQNVELLD